MANRCEENSSHTTAARGSDATVSVASWIVLGLLVPVHTLLLMANVVANSATADELGHLASGVAMWKLDRFDIYMVNPPLVRLVAAVPATLDAPPLAWPHLSEDPGVRPEWEIGRDFARLSGRRVLWYVVLGRLMCLPFSIVGLVACWMWARQRLGDASGVAAATMWTFSPLVLANGSLLTSDLASATFGIVALTAFDRWLQVSTIRRAFLAGLALGLAEATKLTWIVLFPLYVVVWIGRRLLASASAQRSTDTDTVDQPVDGSVVPSMVFSGARLWWSEGFQLCLLFLVAITFLGVSYKLTKVLVPLGRMEFYSRALSGRDGAGFGASEEVCFTETGNRFAGTPLERVPLIVPAAYLQGLDIQRRDFEGGWKDYDSYAAGIKAKQGWWWFYPYCIGVKCPLAMLGLMLLAIPSSLRWFMAGLRQPETLVLSLIPLGVACLVVMETSFSRCFRYLLPVWPFLIIVVSSTFSDYARPGARRIAGCLLTAFAATSLAATPQHLSYFNAFVGGGLGGHRALLDSNLDWGQDLFRLKAWRSQPAHASGDLFLAVSGTLDPEVLGIRYRWPDASVPGSRPHLEPGWYVVSANLLYGFDAESRSWEYFQQERPVDRIGDSLFVYRVLPAKDDPSLSSPQNIEQSQ